jgi:hypothetical protein
MRRLKFSLCQKTPQDDLLSIAAKFGSHGGNRIDIDKLISYIDAPSSPSSRGLRVPESTSIVKILQRKVYPHMGVDVYQTFCRSDVYDAGWVDDESFK